LRQRSHEQADRLALLPLEDETLHIAVSTAPSATNRRIKE
jgi:hypothetical protein